MESKKKGDGHSVTTDKEAKAYQKKQKSRNYDMSWREFVLKIPSYRSSSVIEQPCAALEKVTGNFGGANCVLSRGDEFGKNEAI